MDKLFQYINSPSDFGVEPYTLYRSMMVNPERKIIYFKIGKTAGTSVFRHGLQKKINGWLLYTEDKRGFNRWKNNLEIDDLGEYFKFTIVRNPYDRLVSAWAYIAKQTPKKIDKDFKLFVKKQMVDKTGKHLDDHWAPQRFYFEVGRKQFVDEIYRFETLKVDVKRLFSKLKLKNVELTCTNSSHHQHYVNYYNDEIKKIVFDFYKRDLEILGYGFNK